MTTTATLREALRAAAPRGDAAILARTAVPLAALARGTVLGPARAELAGRSVLLATGGQLAAATALVDLDGLAGRIVLCPPDLPPDLRAALVADAGAERVVTDLDPAGFEELRLPVVPCGLPLRPLDGAAAPACGTEWVMATSGTSGRPKLVAHTLAALTGAIRPAATPSGRPIAWATFYDIRRYGGLQIFLRAMLGGTALVLSDPDEPLVAHLHRLRDAGVTHLTGTPSHWRRVLMSAEAGAVSPDYIRLSGEIADQAVLDSLREAYPTARVGHAYASTEAGVGFEVTDGLEGFPAALLDRAGDLVLAVEDGTLRIRSPRAASRYLGQGAEPLRDARGFVDTGDLVERRGDRFHFVGRRSGVINVGGLKVHPEEVEAVINRDARVRMSLVKARRSPITGAIVVAEVVLTGAAGAEPEEGLRADLLRRCRDHLPTHKVPATLRFVPHLAVTAAGKLARHA